MNKKTRGLEAIMEAIQESSIIGVDLNLSGAESKTLLEYAQELYALVVNYQGESKGEPVVVGAELQRILGSVLV